MIFALYAIETDVEDLIAGAGLETALGTIGGHFDRNAGFAPGYVTVLASTPAGPLAAAGIRPGDHLRFDKTYDYHRHLRVGETTGLTLDRGGVKTHMTLTAAAPPVSAGHDMWTLGTLNDVGCVIVALLGAFVAWRGRNLTAVVLGAVLVCNGSTDVLPPLTFSGPLTFLPAIGAGAACYGAIPVLFYAFTVAFYRDTVGPLKRRDRIGLAAYAIVQMAATLVLLFNIMTLTRFPLVGNGYMLSNVTTYFGFAAAFYYLFVGWRHSPAENQQRYALLVVAMSAEILGQALVTLAFFVLVLPDAQNSAVIAASEVLGLIVGPSLFAYTIFRHKVFDLGFAVNRTLVYGVLSAVLLVAFGLIEWASEHFMPIKNRETNALLDAAIALAIFLVFHRVRDFVEHNIEKLFFRKWHEKEAALKRFVKEAGFMLKREPLAEAFVAELRRFGDGVECALYLQDDSGDYLLAEGELSGAPLVVDADELVVVALRADRTAVEPDDTSARPSVLHTAALALPMVHRAEVIGFVLLGAKASGFSYRPDEKAVLDWAAHQIGLDLHALEVERLQKRVTVLDIELAALKGHPPQRLPA